MTLHVQNWLRNNNGDLELLEKELDIKTTVNNDNRVIFNYSKSCRPSIKNHPIVKECRGLVLDSNNNWNIVARAFKRFFNVNEVTEEDEKFNWDDFYGMHKEDGSLILTYFWNGQWYINTRGSFGNSNVLESNITWRELVTSQLPEGFFEHANKNYTYVFELCSIYNKVIRQYDNPTLFLLSIFEGENELDIEDLVGSEFIIPLKIKFNNLYEVKKYIDQQSSMDITFEGLVLVDNHKNRLKLKSCEYVYLHRIFSNRNLYNDKHLIPFIVNGEIEEVCCYFPEIKDRVKDIQDKIEKQYYYLEELWNKTKHIESQKEFALQIKDNPYCAILFQARKTGESIRELYYNTEYLVKHFS